ncbi:hypothetical protein NMH_1070 [Neisseria meningitidis H44/76]|uniref:Uncharacterized protein n=4 Tax=Neisseria meningitidis TaxID=487 RepID=E6MWN0_NEIMH|nr:hypothetical protein NMA510612_1509 [Neisseria meningitidis]EFV63993.1 hypothetical protein NMH_1070 [Neisseria meningitidis H44/76]CBA07607.1 hypothetical protein predicted by Glimmer/Critica [Neisseria meningitidis alpha275]CCA44641.1 hypothetical protein NMALPHA522_1100 [Neisseria meningitidis alpha522]
MRQMLSRLNSKGLMMDKFIWAMAVFSAILASLSAAALARSSM